MGRRTIPNDVKETALCMSFQGMTDSDIRQITGVSERSLKRFRSTHRKNNAVSAKPPAGVEARLLTAMDVKFLCDCVERQPEVSIKELQAELTELCLVEASALTVTRALQREGYTLRTVTQPVLEQNKKEREEFKTLINTDFLPEQLVFANESHFNRLPSRRPYSWSLAKRTDRPGERACRFEFLLRGTKYSFLPALSLDGILHLEVVDDRAITADDFRRFVQDLLPLMNEWPQPRSVLVIDEASIHKAARIREMVEERGARLLYLPANSPDFNPIEHAFSTIESCLRSNCDGVNQETESKDGAVKDAFSEVVQSVTADDAKGYFRDCGYNVPI